MANMTATTVRRFIGCPFLPVSNEPARNYNVRGREYVPARVLRSRLRSPAQPRVDRSLHHWSTVGQTFPAWPERGRSTMHRYCAESIRHLPRAGREFLWGYAGRPMDTAEIRCQNLIRVTKTGDSSWVDFSQCPSGLRPPALAPLPAIGAGAEHKIIKCYQDWVL
jgi:hypothetical protein